MGAAKAWLMEQWDRGWYAARRGYVCADCFNEEAIRAFVSRNVTAIECDYCGNEASEPIAASADAVLELMYDSIRTEWGTALDENLPWESAEGGWVLGPTYDTYELLDELDLPVLGDAFLSEVLHSFGDHMWCQRDFYALRREEALGYGWHEFVERLKHHSRYVFLALPDDPDEYGGVAEIPVATMLDEIGSAVRRAGLIRTLPAGIQIVRARVHSPDEELVVAADLGLPPLEKATVSNRMSPAGIPMFYGSEAERTAVVETFDPKQDIGRVVTTGTFETTRDLLILDLAALPDIPSLFDETHRAQRSPLIFLHGFAEDLAQPIARDGREHIEYVPTQVVTEFFRRVFRTDAGDAIDGVAYRSSKLPECGPCYVLFVEATDCGDNGAAEPPPTLLLSLAPHRLTQQELNAALGNHASRTGAGISA